LADIVAPDFVRHSQATAGPEVRSLDEFVTLQRMFLASMPDQRVAIDQVVAEGDLVAVRARYSGTLTGPMGDFPATGKSAETTFLAMFRIADRKIAEMWVEWDNMAILTQLGLFPPAARPEG
jgi:predicted ester cyclase